MSLAKLDRSAVLPLLDLSDIIQNIKNRENL